MSWRRSCPCHVPHSGVTGTRPAAPTWPRGGSGVLGEDPAFPPCPRSPGTGPYALRRGRKPQRLCVPVRGSLPVTAPERWGGGHGGHSPPSRSQLPGGSKPALTPSPNPAPCEHRTAPYKPPRTPRPPPGTDNWGPSNTGGQHAPNHALPHHRSDVTRGPRPLKRCHLLQHLSPRGR